MGTIIGLSILFIVVYLIMGTIFALALDNDVKKKLDNEQGMTDAQAGGVIMLWPLFILKYLIRFLTILPRAIVRGVKAGTGLWVKL